MPSPKANVATVGPALRTPRYPLLDSLRGVAALSVFGAHLVAYLGLLVTQRSSPFVSRLDAGIAVFFLLSSFLLYRPYAQARFDGTTGPALVPFALRRLVRIVPVYWGVLTIAALYQGLSYVFTPGGVLHFYGFAQIYDRSTITGGIGQAWTVCIEVTFYAMLPLWAFLLRRFPARSTRGFLLSELGALLALALLSVAWKYVFFTRTPVAAGIVATDVTVGLYVMPAYLDALAVGMGLAVVSVALARREHQPAFVRVIDRWPAAFVLAAAGFWWLSGLVGGTGSSVRSAWAYIVHQQLNVLSAFCLFLPAIFGDPRRGRVRRALAHPVLVWMAAISYGVYLWHLVVMSELARAGWLSDPGHWAFGLGSFAITVVLSAVSYYAVGRPFLRLGARIPRDGMRRHGARADAHEPVVKSSGGP